MRFHIDSFDSYTSDSSTVEHDERPNDHENDHREEAPPSPSTIWIPPVPIPPEVLEMPFDVVLETFPWLPRVLQDHLFDYNRPYLFREHPESYPGGGQPLHYYEPTFDPDPHRGPEYKLEARAEANDRQDRYRATASRNGVPPVLTEFREVDFSKSASRPVDQPVSPRTDADDRRDQPPDGHDNRRDDGGLSPYHITWLLQRHTEQWGW
ncbi:hypothetical protein Hte_010944 [Hypoxylon texense]